MAAMAADAGSVQGWSLPSPASSSGYMVEKARQAATSTVQVLWSTTEAAWRAWSVVVAVVPTFRTRKADQDVVDLEGGSPR